jgi:hypothetical protein
VVVFMICFWNTKNTIATGIVITAAGARRLHPARPPGRWRPALRRARVGADGRVGVDVAGTTLKVEVVAE